MKKNDQPRGKTTPESNSGSFAPKGTPAEHRRLKEIIDETEEEKYTRIRAEYEAAVNPELLTYIQNVSSDFGKTEFKLIGISDKEIVDIKNATDIDVTGFSRVILSDSIRHIEKRHGKDGIADKSMSDPSDIARMEYVLEHYDKIGIIQNTSRGYKNKDNTNSRIIVYEKRINGNYFIAEAVPDSKLKRLVVVSVYKNKA